MLEVPSKLFYNDEIEALANSDNVKQYTKWSKLPVSRTENFPLVFVGVNGQHFHQIDSPSFYNPAEIIKVVEIIQSLLSQTDLGYTRYFHFL